MDSMPPLNFTRGTGSFIFSERRGLGSADAGRERDEIPPIQRPPTTPISLF